MKPALILTAILVGTQGFASQLTDTKTLVKPSAKMTMEKVANIIVQNNVTVLDQLPGLLPPEFRLNFILKHGREVLGPRGHLFEIDLPGLGQASEPLRPRAILFDEDNGFSVSYNGSLRQRNGHTFDMMEYKSDSGFHFWKYDFNGTSAPALNQNDCTTCHGPQARIRPIFSMYPDWPGFYGSDNDELTNPNIKKIHLAGYDPFLASGISSKHQENEYFDYKKFRDTNGQKFKRYSPLFISEEKRALLKYDEIIANVSSEPGRKSVRFSQLDDGRFNAKARPGSQLVTYPWEYLFQLIPYRPAHTLVATRDLSRSFTMRAGLRFNILMSRYHTQNLVRLATNHKNFDQFGKFFTYNLMRCTPSTPATVERYLKLAEQELKSLDITDDAGQSLVPASDPRRSLLTIEGPSLVRSKNAFSASGPKQKLLEYERAWMLLGFELRDVDMRYSYMHPAYQNYQKVRSHGQTNKEGDKMKLGYFGTYFNAYNDGSTTLDELMAGHLIRHFVKTDKAFNEKLKDETRKVRWSYVEKIVVDGKTIQIDENGNRSSNKVSQSFFVDNPGIANDDLNLWGFSQKYGRFPSRYTLDRSFFKKMDKLGTWINLPYAKDIKDDHHRAPWNKNNDTGDKGAVFANIYDSVCRTLESSLTK